MIFIYQMQEKCFLIALHSNIELIIIIIVIVMCLFI